MATTAAPEKNYNHEFLVDAREALTSIDLRTLPKDVRQPIKDARTLVKDALKVVKD